MANINSYPKATAKTSDLLLGTSTPAAGTDDKPMTRNFGVSDITALAPQGTITSVGLTMPAGFSVAGSPITSAGTFSVTGAGSTAQFVDGTGALQTIANLPFVDGTGTANTIPIWSDSDTLGDSIITYNSSGGAGNDFMSIGLTNIGNNGGVAFVSTSQINGIDLTIQNITGFGTGTVNLKGNTIIGDANTDTLTINAASSFTTPATFSNGGISGGIKMTATSPLIFLDGGNSTRLTIGGNITSNSIINESGSGDLILVSNTEIEIKSGELGENFAKFTKDGPIELYYDNVKKFETASSSIKILGVPVHADNAAALAAGLIVGEVYRTGDLLKIVH